MDGRRQWTERGLQGWRRTKVIGVGVFALRAESRRGMQAVPPCHAGGREDAVVTSLTRGVTTSHRHWQSLLT